jgi:hypothetical protein
MTFRGLTPQYIVEIHMHSSYECHSLTTEAETLLEEMKPAPFVWLRRIMTPNLYAMR